MLAACSPTPFWRCPGAEGSHLVDMALVFFCRQMPVRAEGAEGVSWGLWVSPLEGGLGSRTSFENTLFSLFGWSHTGPKASSGSPERTALYDAFWPSWPVCPQLVPESQLSAGTAGREVFSQVLFLPSPVLSVYRLPLGRPAWMCPIGRVWTLLLERAVEPRLPCGADRALSRHAHSSGRQASLRQYQGQASLQRLHSRTRQRGCALD